MMWILLIVYIVFSVVIRDLLLRWVTTKKEKATIEKINELKREQHRNPSQKINIGSQIYTLRFSSWKFGLKSVFVKFGSIILLSKLCLVFFSSIKFAILFYIVGVIGIGIIYRRRVYR